MTQAHEHSAVRKTHVLLLLMVVIWAVNFSLIKYAVQYIPPLAFTGLRVGISAALLLAIAVRRRRAWPPRRDMLALIMLGVIGNGIYQILFVEGLSRTKVGNAALIIAASPAFIAVVSRMRGIERLRRKTLAGVALSVCGVGLVVLGSAHSDHSNATLFGTLLVFCGVLCWTMFTVLLQPLATRVDPIQLSALTMTGGTLPLILVSPPAIAELNWASVGPLAWGCLFYASVISMVIAYLFWYRGLRVIGPTRTAVFGNLQPVVAIGVAWLFLGELPTVWQGVGTAAILGGLFLTRS
jgi:drug/metabolite transporter (DMT)-like permease